MCVCVCVCIELKASAGNSLVKRKQTKRSVQFN